MLLCLCAHHPPSQMREQQLQELDMLCRSRGIKLLIVRSYGLMGYMRVRRESPGGGAFGGKGDRLRGVNWVVGGGGVADGSAWRGRGLRGVQGGGGQAKACRVDLALSSGWGVPG